MSKQPVCLLVVIIICCDLFQHATALSALSQYISIASLLYIAITCVCILHFVDQKCFSTTTECGDSPSVATTSLTDCCANSSSLSFEDSICIPCDAAGKVYGQRKFKDEYLLREWPGKYYSESVKQNVCAS